MLSTDRGDTVSRQLFSSTTKHGGGTAPAYERSTDRDYLENAPEDLTRDQEHPSINREIGLREILSKSNHTAHCL